jgi:hypothetical protein
MSADTVRLPLPDAADVPLGVYRPVLPSRGPGSWLRGFIGVQEDILDWAPEERARYSRLGAIVLNTGMMAALSLLVALHSIATAFWLFLVPAALIWGYVIVSFDGWLIASTHGLLGKSKLRIFVPRLVISLLMGAVIAEPLLLWIFQPAVHKEVLDERQTEINDYTGQLKLCNPVSGVVVATASCRDFHVNVGDSPQVVQEQLTTTISNRAHLQALVDDINRQLAAKQQLANDECAGIPRPGVLSGQVGEGPRCQRETQQAQQFRSDNQLDQRQADLTGLNQQVDALTASLDRAKATYGTEVSKAIAAQMRQKQADQGAIGLLDEEKALATLSGKDSAVFAAEWLVRLLLIAIDCLPALTKLMGGNTTYDQLVFHQLETSRSLHARYVGMRERRDAASVELRSRRTEHGLQSRLDRLTVADQFDRAQREADKEAQIEELAARLRVRPS